MNAKAEIEKSDIEEIQFEEVDSKNLQQIEEVITPAVGSVLCCNQQKKNGGV